MSRFSLESSALSLVLLLGLAGFGCANFGPGLSGTPCPVDWVSSDAIDPKAAALRARMELRIADEEIHLEIISERRFDELVVVGLARFGVRLFALRQRGVDVVVEGASTEDLELVAIWTMDALHRVYWIERPPESSAVRWTWAGEEVSERSTHGLRHREYTVTGTDDPTRRVTIDYARSTAASDLQAETVSIRNPWCGYEAIIAPIRSARSL